MTFNFGRDLKPKVIETPLSSPLNSHRPHLTPKLIITPLNYLQQFSPQPKPRHLLHHCTTNPVDKPIAAVRPRPHSPPPPSFISSDSDQLLPMPPSSPTPYRTMSATAHDYASRAIPVHHLAATAQPHGDAVLPGRSPNRVNHRMIVSSPCFHRNHHLLPSRLLNPHETEQGVGTIPDLSHLSVAVEHRPTTPSHLCGYFPTSDATVHRALCHKVLRKHWRRALAHRKLLTHQLQHFSSRRVMSPIPTRIDISQTSTLPVHIQ